MNSIAKNTLLLYARMLLLLFIGLYTSRVVMAALGIEDTGIYNAVGGFVALFSVLSGSLSASISRFLTYKIGEGADEEELGRTFAASLTIQLILATVIVILAEILGPWFLSEKMTIPPERLQSAKTVLQLSILTFFINLISVPYNAAIISRERMGAFATIGILEGCAKLGVALLISCAPFDRLVWYALLMTSVAFLTRLAYGTYCRRNFQECRVRLRYEHSLVKEMFSFAGWNFIGASSAVLRDQGGTLLINIFSGPAANAARAVATQLSGAVQGFVTNFMTAINPQITKSYASGDREYMTRLIFKGARFSFFLLLFIGLPVIANMEFLMGVWLKDVPPLAVLFARLTILFAMSESLSHPLVTVTLATGDIKLYQIIVGGLQLLNVPVSWILLSQGFGPEYVLITAIVISQLCLFARLILLKNMINLPSMQYLKEVYLRVLVCTALSAAPLLPMRNILSTTSVVDFCISCSGCIIWTGIIILTLGLKSGERKELLDKLFRKEC